MDSLSLIRKMIVEYGEVAAEDVQPEAVLTSLNVDSLSLAEMLFALEGQVGRSITEPTERPQTVADLQKLVEPFMGQLSAESSSD